MQFGPQCSCNCRTRIPLSLDANRCDESKIHVLFWESDTSDNNATVGETHAFPLTLTPVAAMKQIHIGRNGFLDENALVGVARAFPLDFSPIVATS